ncbi:MAG: hypothetical protein KGI33_01090 [Thaumarchaeota archaeon]|nr:hypothetical protein [Nitrososphaerota archaeon]
MRKNIIVAVGGGVAAAAIIAVVYIAFFMPTKDYSLYVEAMISRGPYGTYSHITLRNTGRDPVTHVKVDFGNNTRSDIIPVIGPGQRVILSHPSGVVLSQVRVTTAEGIDIVKPYTQPTEGPLVGIGNIGTP